MSFDEARQILAKLDDEISEQLRVLEDGIKQMKLGIPLVWPPQGTPPFQVHYDKVDGRWRLCIDGQTELEPLLNAPRDVRAEAAAMLSDPHILQVVVSSALAKRVEEREAILPKLKLMNELLKGQFP